MPFYLRVEAVNLSHFINDTNDLSTIRGGSLLLLEAMKKVEGIIKNNSPEKIRPEEKEIADLEKQLNDINTLQKLTPKDKNKKKNIREKLRKLKATSNKVVKPDSTPTITKGASWGLFVLDMSEADACKVQKKIADYFKTDARYRLATFVVDLYPNNGDEHYQADRNCLQTLNRWQQMQAPSLAICKEGTTSCAIDKVRPATILRYLKNKKYDYVSKSVNQRRKYGIVKKRTFYNEVTGIYAKYTQDLGDLSKSAKNGILDGKIAFIYIDGNGFGDIQRSSKTPAEQKQFDENTRHGREKLLTKFLEKIHNNPDWLTDDGKVRMETLLWGGDEIIWVVPAWQGWWMLNEFYSQAKELIKHNNEPLFHAAGLVFCHNDAPIHRIDSLARALADQFAKTNRDKNLIAYQILESFDHAGIDLQRYRVERIGKLGGPEQLLIDAEKMDDIKASISQLKNDPDFAKRKVYQILEAYSEDETLKADQYIAKLPGTSAEPLEKLKHLFGGDKAQWLHLMDLWDYID
ncbi:MAG: hypothetical protein WC856_23385 [Methylococcaceae bacterium]|jgi:hypothetical protein